MTAPHEVSGRALERQGESRIDAWSLCAEFIELIVANAQSAVPEELRRELSDVDWDSIWRAGEGASSDELSIGRIVRAASDVTGRIALDRREHSQIRGPTCAKSNGAVVPDAVPLAKPPERREESVAHAEPRHVVAPLSPISEPLVVPVESPTTASESVSTITDPVSESAPTRSDAIDTISVADPQTPVTTQIAASATEEFPDVIAAPVPDAPTSGELARETATVTREHSAWFHVFTWMRNIGAILLLFVVWQLWGTAIAQHQEQGRLKSQFDAELRGHHPPVTVKAGALIPASTRFSAAADGSVLARLQIPTIGVDQYVVEGTNSSDLSKGPGHYVGTALPGQAGNVAIAGHRTTHGAPFNGLGHLVPGDRITLTTSWGEHLRYVVMGAPQIVSPSDVAVLNYFGDNRITLTTCNPEFSSSQRLIVVGKLDQLEKTPKPTKPVKYQVANSDTSSWNFSLLPTIGVEVCLLLLLGLSYRYFRAFFKSGTKWLILVPLWAAGLYLLFGTLTIFLPSSI